MRRMFEVEDAHGRSVSLFTSQWRHIRRGHPEMADAVASIELTVADPDVVVRARSRPRDPHGERVVHSRLGTHPRYRHLYVRVPIEYSPSGNWVVTAHLALLPPEGDLIYVRAHR